MKTRKIIAMTALAMGLMTGCNRGGGDMPAAGTDFEFVVEQFADLKVMRYQVPGFEDLSLGQKELIYYLSQAALCGRDIIYDQNGKYNLAIRRTLEAVYGSYQGDRDAEDFGRFLTYTKRVWFSNGIYHHCCLFSR